MNSNAVGQYFRQYAANVQDPVNFGLRFSIKA